MLKRPLGTLAGHESRGVERSGDLGETLSLCPEHPSKGGGLLHGLHGGLLLSLTIGCTGLVGEVSVLPRVSPRAFLAAKASRMQGR